MALRQAHHTRKDEEFMRLALKLAEKGRAKTYPNPMVGSVVVKKGRILARGYHRKFGGPHAETIAIKACGEAAKGATLYTTLEPCCHFGKTPPCTDLIVQSRIKEVVCSTTDPNPKVNGKGIRRLKKEGVKVSVGVLVKEARRLNEVHFKYMTTRLPFVTLALAQTLDGRILPLTRLAGTTRRRVFLELIQSEKPWIDAVLCDANSAQRDSLGMLLRSSKSAGTRVILIGTWREISVKLARLRRDKREGIVCVPTDGRRSQGKPETWRISKKNNGEVDLIALLQKAGEHGITALLVEGGNRTATWFLKQRLVDRIWCFISPEIQGMGEESVGDLGIREIRSAINLEDCQFRRLREGLLVIGYPAEVHS